MYYNQTSASALPGFVQTSTKPLQTQLSQTITDLTAVIQSPEGTTSQKAMQVASAVQNQIGPVLEALKETYVNLSSGNGSGVSGKGRAPLESGGVAAADESQ